MNNKRVAITLVANIVVFLVNGLIGLLLTPFVVEHVGEEAYGFVSLANSFTNYANILMLAINSMAGRYITVEMHRGNHEQAKKYFNSVFVANLIMTGVFLLPILVCIFFPEYFINISPELTFDVKILFATVFLSFFLSLWGTCFSCSTFAANRKDLEAKRQIESYFIKAGTLIICFSFFVPHIYYLGFSMALMSGYVLVTNIRYTKKLTPSLKIEKGQYDKKSLRILLKSGIWNSVERLSGTLFTGCDALIANLFINGSAMGVLSVAKLVPGLVEMLIWQISAIFIPEYTIAYAKDDKVRFKKAIRKTISVASIMSNVCICALCVLSKEFYRLWVPGQDENVLSILSVLTLAAIFVSAGIYCMYNIAIVVDKIKIPALAKTCAGLLSIAITIVLLLTTDLGIFAIAGVSSMINILFNLVFYVPYISKCIGEKKWLFYKPVLVNVFVIVLTVAMGFFIKSFFVISGWMHFFMFGAIVGVMALIINVVFCTGLEDKRTFVCMVKNKLKR